MLKCGFNKALFYYEPIPSPVLDKDGNILCYERCSCVPMTLKDSDKLRLKSFPNELGLSADPDNVCGFARLLEVINQNRNVRTSGLSEIGYDAANLVCSVTERVKSIRSISKAS